MLGKRVHRPGIADQLALYGGRPVRNSWLPYGHQSIDEGDIAAVVQVLRSDWITQGPKVDEFEQAVANYCGANYGVAFSSGTAALHAACVAAGLGPGDEAITTPLTFIATANAVVYCGTKPVFADIREDTLTIDPGKIEKLITPKTRAVLPMDFAGHPADLDEIRTIAKANGLCVIEDAAHALGAEYKGQKVGSISDMAVFSFHPVKQITTGEGGMVLTNDRTSADGLRTLRHHGISYSDRVKPWEYEVSELGYNYRLSDIHCALGISQLQRVDTQLARRNAIAKRYQEAFSEISELSVLSTDRRVTHAWHLFVVLLSLDRLSLSRDTILRALRAENIGATVHYPLVHLHPFYRGQFGYGKGLCPVAEVVSPRMLTLPLFPAMMDQDVDDVVECISKILSACRA